MGCLIYENALLSPYCSMKVGGKARLICLPKTVAELIGILKECREKYEKTVVVGNCSDLLFPDGGYDGAVIITTGVRGISYENGKITACCGEPLGRLASIARENSMTGFEFCHGIPGTVGGGVYMNAGAYGSDISSVFESGIFLNGNFETLTLFRREMDFDYRKSILQKSDLIFLSGVFSGKAGDKEEISAKMDELMASRKAKQPLEFPSCGSAFKRPKGHFAGALIEQCGLKGFSVGGAKISEKHAGFIINCGNASASDVISLMEKTAKTVYEKTGVKLEPEIRVME